MQPAQSRLTHLRLAVLAAIVLAAPAAHAFTLETPKSNNDGSLFIDPDVKVEQFGNGSVPTRPGDSSFHFYMGPSNNAFGRPQDRGFGAAGQFIPMPGQIPEQR